MNSVQVLRSYWYIFRRTFLKLTVSGVLFQSVPGTYDGVRIRMGEEQRQHDGIGSARAVFAMVYEAHPKDPEKEH